MLAGRGIGELAGGAPRRILEPHEHRAARRIVDITNQPTPPLALAVGVIMTAHRLGLFGLRGRGDWPNYGLNSLSDLKQV